MMRSSGWRETGRRRGNGIALVVLWLTVPACGGKEKSPAGAPAANPAPGAESPAAAPGAEPAAAAMAAGPAAAEAAAAALPAAATLAQAVTEGQAAAGEATDSISLHVGRPGSDAFGLPEPGKPARLKVTPVDGSGRPIAAMDDLDPLTPGVQHVLGFAYRRDFAWSTALAPTQPLAGAAVFDLTFPKTGPHSVWFISRRTQGKARYDQASLRVMGDWAAADPPGASLSATVGGLRAELVAQGEIVACKELTPRLRLWRGAKALEVAPDAVQWLAMPMEAQDRVLLSRPGAAGAAPTLEFDANVTFLIHARVRAGKDIIAPGFVVRVGGSVPVGGCAALRAAQP